MEEHLKKLSEGSPLLKVRSENKVYNRVFRVDEDSIQLVAESKKWWLPKKVTSIPLIEVTEVREGWKTDTFNRVSDYVEKTKGKGSNSISSTPQFDESLCFSLIHGAGGRSTLDLMATSKEQRDLWVEGLHIILKSVQALHQDRMYDMWLKKKFEGADKDKNGALNLDEISKLVASLNLSIDSNYSKKLFNEANRSKSLRHGEQVLDKNEFVQFYHSLQKMPMVEDLYKRYTNKETNVMSPEELLQFLKSSSEDYSQVTLKEATEMIRKFESSTLKENNFLSFDGFYHMLLSDSFDVFNNVHRTTVNQDMSRPLAHYFISSSHNTYLLGNQLAGESSVEGYISALKKGCRLVELDVWDGEDGEPIIYHGHTLTSRISLSDVLKDAIKPYAFTVSPYPVILSIENHLSVEQQVVMVKLLKDILKDSLQTDAAPSDLKVLPSPEDLKYKVLVKAKKPKGEEIEDDDEEDDQDAINYIGSADGNAASKKGETHKPLAPELGQVVNFCEGKKFSSFSSSFEEDKCVHFPSLRENKASDLLQDAPLDFIRFTKRQIAKVYPLGTRTDSSNLKPYPFWTVGVQAVTLNMQTEDKANFYNDSLFRRNGGCGYVLKPDILTGQGTYDPRTPSSDISRVLRVKVISGQHLPLSEKKNEVVDPYVQLKIRGHENDKQSYCTKVVKNNGFNPVWNEDIVSKIKVPDVALVYFCVRDENFLAKDPVLAMACVPFGSLSTGYRHVHLTDITGKRLGPAALFVHVSIRSE